MEQKIATVCLMNSRRIHQTLRELSATRTVSNDRHMAVVAALKLLETDYQGVDVETICDDLSRRPEQDLEPLARLVHPVLCSLRLEKWLKESGQCQYIAEGATPVGGVVRRILLDDKAQDIPPAVVPGKLLN
jgi:hypothetical protein